MEINNSCSDSLADSVVSDSNDSSKQLMRGIIVSTFECGEVAAIIFYDSSVTIADGVLECRDEEGTGGIYFTNFISENMVITVAILSTKMRRKIWTADFGIVSSVHKNKNLRRRVKVAVANVPFDAKLTWKIELGSKKDPSRLSLVSRAPWNAGFKPEPLVKEQPAGKEDLDFSVLAVTEHWKVEKNLSCFVFDSDLMYCHSQHEYILIALPSNKDIKCGSSVLADVFWCGWNGFYVAVQIKPESSVNVLKYHKKAKIFSVEIEGLLYGLYKSTQLGLVSDPLCMLQRLQFSKSFSVWVKHSNNPNVYPVFSIVGLVNESDCEAPKVGLISKLTGFIKDIYGCVHAPMYPSLRFYFKADAVGNFTVGRFIKFDAEFDEETGFFWITSAKLNLQPMRLMVGVLGNGAFVFRASFAAAIGNLVRNEDIGFVEDKYRQLKGNVNADTFWFMFKQKGSLVVPMSLLSPKDAKKVEKVENAVHCLPLDLDRKNHNQFQTYQIAERGFTPETYDEMGQFLNASLSVPF
uniref:Uncharacterized protein n=1 Tax=Ditylenchus dipsaci TaxID=166011 RepID=A0A915CR93_9BILA